MSLKDEAACWGLIISMEHSEKLSLEQIRTFLEASGDVQFHAPSRREWYEWVNHVLRQQDYMHLGRQGKGLVRRY